MRKWQDLAPPDDPGSWYDVDGVWPTDRGTYEMADYLGSTELTATGAGNMSYAFVAKTLTSTREYVVDASKMWEYSGGSLTDRTNGVTIGTPMMAQYGNITICVMGNSVATVSSSGGNFSALAGAPKGNIVCVHKNAVLIFNTDTSADGWAASDVGDYTNWTTGEAASGRLIETPGDILGACVLGDAVYVFKPNSIYRMRYVGGQVKWMTEVVFQGIGLAHGTPSLAKHAVCAGNRGILFPGSLGPYGPGMFLFDGVSQPVKVNPLTKLTDVTVPRISYNGWYDIFCIYDNGVQDAFFYNATSDAWGRNTSPLIGYAYNPSTVAPLMGDFAARDANYSPMPVVYTKEAADKIKRYALDNTSARTVYLTTSMMGAADRKTAFRRASAILRRRTDIGTNSAAATLYLYRELHDTTEQSSRAVTESTVKNRFDLMGGAHTDNFARIKFSFTDLDIEIDDVLVDATAGGLE